ncbi:MAG TPA: TlpA disulfide reductase family protein [Verrucomicrobiae bacterium]|nr:TlpA disulfide reductase family protein [Verrucomicrobiae bacterium]
MTPEAALQEKNVVSGRRRRSVAFQLASEQKSTEHRRVHQDHHGSAAASMYRLPMRCLTILLFSLACVSICSAEPPHTNRFTTWWHGHQYRLNLQGKPVPMKFTALDGREVDLAQMRGKVVLVDFWYTRCQPCVEELPRVKAAYEKYQEKGFAVIGISSDTDKTTLEKFLKEKGISWPQYFEGRAANKFTAEFGINGFPHMFLVDKQGCLRFDDVRASGAVADFEGKIESLLAEKYSRP